MLLLCAVVGHSQVKFEGKVLDTLQLPLEKASVVAINNATNALDAFAMTNDKGLFSLKLKEKTEYNIQVCNFGVQSVNESLKTTSENLTKNSIDKMKKKHCDLIFANDVSQKGIGFNSDYNKISVIDKKGNIKIIPKNKKSFIANKIAEILLDKLLIDDRNTN